MSASTPTPTPTSEPQPANGINRAEKLFAGILLSGFTAAALIVLISLWPDRLPNADDNCQLYAIRFLGARLMTDTCCSLRQQGTTVNAPPATTDGRPVQAPGPTAAAREPAKRDSADSAKAATAAKNAGKGAAASSPAKAASSNPAQPCPCSTGHCLTFNKLLLLLVCIGGFLGAMIHGASSFTVYIGAGKFVRSWALWYFVNPFIGAGLAVTVYFAFHAGLLAKEYDARDVNMYGVMALALMTGLFTRTATQKLKEIFEAAVKPKDNLPNKIDDPNKSVTS